MCVIKLTLIVIVIVICNFQFGLCKPNPEEFGKKYQGDIIRSKNRFDTSGNKLPQMQSSGLVDKNYRWSKKVVPFIISKDFGKQNYRKILKAIKELENKTCLKFVPRKKEEDYIYIVNGDGCESYVGRQGGKQNVSLNDPGCMLHGSILHELIHAIGFEHEQSRSDRSKYVTILWGNVEIGMEDNFDKYGADEIHEYDLPYDYSSIMHYSDEAFQKTDELKTMITSRLGAVVGQRHHMTAIDAEKVNRMYNCKVKSSGLKQLQKIKQK